MILEKDFLELKNGDVVQVKCVDGKWYNALVIETEWGCQCDGIYVHHMGPDNTFKEKSIYGTNDGFNRLEVRKISYDIQNTKTIKAIKKLAESLEG